MTEVSPSPSISPSPSPTTQSISVEVTEIMACPETGESEWIELYNNSNQAATITAWKVRDNANNSKTISLDIPAHEYQIAEWSGSLLNNAGDELHLEDESGDERISIDLPACTKGSSFIYVDNLWQETDTPSPGKENILQLNESVDNNSATTSAIVGIGTTTTKEIKNSADNTNQYVEYSVPTQLARSLTPTPTPINYQIPNYTLEQIEHANPFEGQQIDIQTTEPNKTIFVSFVIGGVLLFMIGVIGLHKLIHRSGVLQ